MPLPQKKNKIHYYLSYRLRKCPVVERFNITLQRLLYKMMKQNNTYEWSKLLNPAMKIYLNRKHRTIKMSLLEAEKEENEPIIRQTYWKRYRKAGEKKRKPKFSVWDSVRIFIYIVGIWKISVRKYSLWVKFLQIYLYLYID